MEKKYQVFVSSTFRDLRNERQTVMRALLELGHMPAGMELFPAADDDAWTLIQSVIDESDYYLLVVGGRYGSIDSAGIGYTEKEYDYAIKSKKPVIAFLHENPEKLVRENTETDPATWERLQLFCKKVETSHHRKSWTSIEDLHSKVVVSMIALVKRTPATGWIRADQLPSDFSVEEMLRLEARVRELEDSLARTRTEPPADSVQFSQGSDIHKVRVHCRVSGVLKTKASDSYEKRSYFDIKEDVSFTWDQLFAFIAPTLIQEARDSDVRSIIKTFLAMQLVPSWRREKELHKEFKKFDELTNEDFHVGEPAIETCVVQLRAIGLIQESMKKRSLKDTGIYWRLTPFGDSAMVKLRAICKSDKAFDVE